MAATNQAGTDLAGTDPAGTDRAGRRFGAGLASRLPAWMGSIRFRLTLLYSVVLFGLGALVLAGVYAGLARSLDDEPVSQDFNITRLQPSPGGVIVREETVRGEIRGLEELVNERALDQLRRYSFASLGLLFVASLGVGWVVAGRVLRPIGRITDVAREIQATDLSRRIHLEGPNDELTKLADTFDDMLDRLDGAFEAQRRFIHDASHELRNPLAVIRTNLDVTLADPEATAEDLRLTGVVVGRTAERMSHLVDDLLTYARRETPALDMEPVEVSELVHETAQEFAGPAEAAGLRVTDEAEAGLSVIGDRHTLRQALTNLVGNAVRLSDAGGTVGLAAGREDGWVWVAVIDDGPGIPEDQQQLVFERFWRGDAARGDDQRTGLGLAIVRQTAEAHGGRVGLVSAPGEGSTFTMWLPGDTPTGSGDDA